jgi:hypothetical protein
VARAAAAALKAIGHPKGLEVAGNFKPINDSGEIQVQEKNGI